MKPSHLLVLGTLLAVPAWGDSALATSESASTVTPSSPSVSGSTEPIVTVPKVEVPPVRGIHLTASAAGSKRYRQNRLEPMLKETVINALVVDIKEEDGAVYIPGVKMVEEAKAYSPAIPDLKEWIEEMKKRNIYMAARVVCFKDNKAPRRFKEMAVMNPNGDIWMDRKKITWLDPYDRESWKYVTLIAVQAAKLGFEEIQFDYIRFPTDGNIKACRYKQPYHKDSASKALVEFLRYATQVLRPMGVKVSIDVFGLTTSVNTGMGIGQRMLDMTAEVDYVCPMTYPSHYARGEYGMADPNDEPYKTIHYAVRDALKNLGPESAHKLRPYYQDFSLPGHNLRYGPDEVRAQIQAAVDLGAPNWTLWNASCKYTTSALKTPFAPKPLPSWVNQPTRRPKKVPAAGKTPAEPTREKASQTR